MMPDTLELERFIESSPLATALLDDCGSLRLVNRSLCRLTGYSRSEMAALHISELIHPEDQRVVQMQLQQAVETDEDPGEIEFRGQTKAGCILSLTVWLGRLSANGRTGILVYLRDSTDTGPAEDELDKEKERYRTILHISDIGYYEVDLAGNFMYLTDVVRRHLGYQDHELTGTNFRQLTDRRTAALVMRRFRDALKSGQPQPFFDWTIRSRDGRILAIQTSVALRTNSQGRPVGFRGIVQNVTEKKRTEAVLRRSKERYRSIFEGAGTPMIITDQDLSLRLVNQRFTELTGYSKQELEGRRSLSDFVLPDSLGALRGHLQYVSVQSSARQAPCEFRLRDRHGSLLDLLGYFNRMPDGLLVASFLDMTERKQMELKLKHLSLHDPMTGLFNRYYFEQELERCKDGRQSPLGIVVLDLDGLKQINDTFGHKAGDTMIKAAARVIAKAFRESDMVARIGGDEFAALLPRSDREVIHKVLKRLRTGISTYNAGTSGFPLHLSIGYSVAEGRSIDPEQLFKQADNAMYRNKQRSSSHSRQPSLSSLDSMLENRGLRYRQVEVLKLNLALNFAEYLKLDNEQLNRLQLLTRFYDIGKIGVEDSILLKPDRLTPQEFNEVARHSRLGSMIASRTVELRRVSEEILAHHERWDGRGYPRQLRAGDIPLLSRIVTIIDAYFAMTTNRPYRRAMPAGQAAEELKRCAGTQFDPSLIDAFLDMSARQGLRLGEQGRA